MGLWDALQLNMNDYRLITFVGGGGKTTNLFAMAHEARMAGKTVIVTTTTHMMPHPGLFLAAADQREGLRELLETYGIVTVGTLTPQGKLTGAEDLEECKRAADIVLVEGDGARLHPLKAPAAHEPVIPSETDAVVALCGLDALGGAIGAVCHRAELVAELLDKPLTAPVEIEDAVKVLLSDMGAHKNVGDLPFRCILNKADTQEKRTQGAAMAALLELAGVNSAVTCYTDEEQGGLAWF